VQAWERERRQEMRGHCRRTAHDRHDVAHPRCSDGAWPRRCATWRPAAGRSRSILRLRRLGGDGGHGRAHRAGPAGTGGR
jgi:hypothetical protein